MAEESFIDLDEVDDRLDIMEQVVYELQRPGLTKAERQIFMKQYTHLESVILKALQDFLNTKSIAEFELRLPQQILRFNKCGGEFQEAWEQELWDAYEFAHQDFELKEAKDKPTIQTAQEIGELQDLALKLAEMNRTTGKHAHRPSLVPKPQTLGMVDLDALLFREPKKRERDPEPQVSSSHCRNCTLM